MVSPGTRVPCLRRAGMDALAAKLAIGINRSRCPLNSRSVIRTLEYLQAMRALTTSPATGNYACYAYPVAVVGIPPACATQINPRPLATNVTGPASRVTVVCFTTALEQIHKTVWQRKP